MNLPDFENIGADHSDDDGGRGRRGLKEHGRQHADHHPHDGVLKEMRIDCEIIVLDNWQIGGWKTCSLYLASLTSLKQLGVGEDLAVLPAAEQPERRRQEAQRADEEVEAGEHGDHPGRRHQDLLLQG